MDIKEALEKASARRRERASELVERARLATANGDVGRAAILNEAASELRTADAQIREMAEALVKIANGDGTYGAQAHEYKEIARAALSTEKHHD